MKLNINSIRVDERQRVELGDIDSLAASLLADGQALPILVTKDKEQFVLVDGYRRCAAATKAGWIEIEAYVREDLTLAQRQRLELIADIQRKDRTWQENCRSIRKIHLLMQGDSLVDGEVWTRNQTATLTGYGPVQIGKFLAVANELINNPEGDVAKAPNFTEAYRVLVLRTADTVRAAIEQSYAAPQPLAESASHEVTYTESGELVKPVQPKPVLTSLPDRVRLFNAEHDNLPPLVIHYSDAGPFIYGYWFLGGYSQSEFYGSYSVEYLKRITSLFADQQRVVHLFAGSMPPGNYTRVGLEPTGQYHPDIVGNAEELSSILPFSPDIIYADPPYTKQEAEDEYQIALVNCPRVVDECAVTLKPGGFLVWLDQRLPVFSNKHLRWCGLISYIRSTGNRFRCICIFQKRGAVEPQPLSICAQYALLVAEDEAKRAEMKKEYE